MFKRIALAFVLTTGLALATTADQPVTIHIIKVPAAALGFPNSTGAIFQVWINGGDADTAAFSVAVKYQVNGLTLTGTAVSPSTSEAGSQPYLSYRAVVLVPLPQQDAEVISVTVQQLKVSSSQDFPGN